MDKEQENIMLPFSLTAIDRRVRGLNTAVVNKQSSQADSIIFSTHRLFCTGASLPLIQRQLYCTSLHPAKGKVVKKKMAG